MAILNRAGVNLFYDVGGVDNDRPPVLLTHGYSSTSEMWRPNLETFRNRRRGNYLGHPGTWAERLPRGPILVFVGIKCGRYGSYTQCGRCW